MVWRGQPGSNIARTARPITAVAIQPAQRKTLATANSPITRRLPAISNLERRIKAVRVGFKRRELLDQCLDEIMFGISLIDVFLAVASKRAVRSWIEKLTGPSADRQPDERRPPCNLAQAWQT
jgi:hypothetical protein